MKVLAAGQLTPTIRVGLEYKLADLWVGAFYARKGAILHVWVCVVPCLPIHIEIGG